MADKSSNSHYALMKRVYQERFMFKKDNIYSILRTLAEKASDRDLVDRAEVLGIHFTPVHSYSPIPQVSSLSKDLWDREASLIGMDIQEQAQLEFLRKVCVQYKEEYLKFPSEATDVPYQFHFNQMMFRSVDAEVLYCMVRHFAPKRIVEVGSGYSTMITARALRSNAEAGQTGELIAIEPYPNDVLRHGFPGLTRLINTPVQQAPLSLFTELKHNDILFIDSSHVVKIGSDVLFLLLEVLPRLNPGVVVHLHDIFLPAEYPKDWVMKEHCFWGEQYLLQAFMAFNNVFEVLWAGSCMHIKHPTILARFFPTYNSQSTWPGSFWIRRTA